MTEFSELFLKVKLLRNENLGFGFSLLGSVGLPHVIYDIVENSPAAECGEVEAGDVIVKVNGADVHRFTTKEVLKCLRLSKDSVTLELKRDPKIKAHVRKYLAQTSNSLHNNNVDIPPFDLNESLQLSPKISQNKKGMMMITDPTGTGKKSRIPQIVRGQTVPPVTPSTGSPNPTKSAPHSPFSSPTKQPNNNQQYHHHVLTSTNGSCNNDSNNRKNHFGSPKSNHSQEASPNQPNNRARFEAYMMTGDLILNLSRTPQNSDLIDCGQVKKVDSLRDSPSHHTSSRRSISRIAQKSSDGLKRAPHAKYDSSPSSPTNDSTEIDEEIERDEEDEGERKVCSCEVMSNSSGESLDRQKKRRKCADPCCIHAASDDSSRQRGQSRLSYEHNNNISDKSCRLESVNNSSVTSSSSNTGNSQSTTSSTRNTLDSHSESAERLISNDNRHTSSSAAGSTARSDLMISSPDEVCFSVPASPTAAQVVVVAKECANSVPTSPETSGEVVRRSNNNSSSAAMNGIMRTRDPSGFRTSRSEDHLQQSQRDGMGTIVPIDIDEDVNSSLNTLLDTRHDSTDDSQNSGHERIVWTYNAPVSQANLNSHSSSISSSPQHTETPVSPTSVSSSVMSSNSSSKSFGNNGHQNHPINSQINIQNSRQNASNVMTDSANLTCPDLSVSEAVSNISSPDYQDDNLLSSKDMAAMAVSDPSDSDSTLLVSDAGRVYDKDNKIVIHVKPNHAPYVGGKGLSPEELSRDSYAQLKGSEDELVTLTEDSSPTMILNQHQQDREASPVSDDGSDVDSLHSFHYSPKAVDIPSAIRLAKRLYSLDGFKKSDVSRHLSKNNDFSRAVADEYLKYFKFEELNLDEALRQFLQQFSLSGETQERERVLVHFSKRYLDCNPGTFNSQDAVHTLTCAIMLLNTDLHGPNIGRRMTCSEFIENLSELNEGVNFPRDVLKYLYQAIKQHPLEWALDDEAQDQKPRSDNNGSQAVALSGPHSLLEATPSVAAIEYKKGYVMRKCCYDSNNKKTPFGKRSWKMFYCTLRDLVLYLHKDEHGFRKNQFSDNVHNAIRIHHALATKANDYTKKQHVFRLQTADQSEYLFQTSDSKELQSWIDTINYVCASFSAPPLEGGVGSQKRYQRPLLPSSHTKLLQKEQLTTQETKLIQLQDELEDHKKSAVPTKGLALQNYKEKETYLQYEIKRYRTYVDILSSRLLASGDNLDGGDILPASVDKVTDLDYNNSSPSSTTSSEYPSSGSGGAGSPTNEKITLRFGNYSEKDLLLGSNASQSAVSGTTANRTKHEGKKG